jgi:hypothetical protein
MSAILSSFAKGSEIGGGKASGAIKKNMGLFGDDSGSDGQDPLRTALMAIGDIHANRGADYVDPETGMTIAQPGALSDSQQNKINIFSQILDQQNKKKQGFNISSLFGGNTGGE